MKRIEQLVTRQYAAYLMRERANETKRADFFRSADYRHGHGQVHGSNKNN